jgi:hypothetical protein
MQIGMSDPHHTTAKAKIRGIRDAKPICFKQILTLIVLVDYDIGEFEGS